MKCGSEHLRKNLCLHILPQLQKSRCTIFAQFFVHFLQSKNSCDIVGAGERKMRTEQLERLKMETKITENELEKLEREVEEFEKEIKQSKEIRRLARLVVSGKLEKRIVD